jgi:hypothetical protein
MFWDDSLKGFGLRAGKTAKTFIVLMGSGRRLRIGHYPLVSLADARRHAQELMASRTLGLLRPAASRITFADAATQFLEASKAKNRPSTTEDYRLRLTRHWLPAFSSRVLAEITRRDVVRAIMHPSPLENQHALVILKTFFSWAVKSGFIEL